MGFLLVCRAALRIIATVCWLLDNFDPRPELGTPLNIVQHDFTSMLELLNTTPETGLVAARCHGLLLISQNKDAIAQQTDKI